MKVNAIVRMKVLVSVVLTVLIIIIGTRVFLVKQWDRIQDLGRQRDRMEDMIRKGSAASDELSRLKRELNGLEQELQSESSNFFPADQSGAVVQLLSLLPERAITFVQPGEVVKREYFTVLPVQVGLAGTYPEILEGLRSLNNSPRKVQVAGIIIKSGGHERDTGLTGGQPSDTLNAEVQLLLYQYPDVNGTYPVQPGSAAAQDLYAKGSPFEPAVVDTTTGGEPQPAALSGENIGVGQESQNYGFSGGSSAELKPYSFPVK